MGAPPLVTGKPFSWASLTVPPLPCFACVFPCSVPAMTIKTDWQTYLSCAACTLSLFVVDGTGVANILTTYTFPNAVTGSYRVGNKEWEYCSRRGRCNQENGAHIHCG